MKKKEKDTTTERWFIEATVCCTLPTIRAIFKDRADLLTHNLINKCIMAERRINAPRTKVISLLTGLLKKQKI